MIHIFTYGDDVDSGHLRLLNWGKASRILQQAIGRLSILRLVITFKH